MHNPKWCIFFDFHTMPACPDVGKKFDFDMITDKIKECGVDYIVFPARCNLGMAYYNTKAGIRHPSLQYDLWGKLSEACLQKGIAISAYINVGLSHEEGLRHRDWTTVNPEGYAYQPPHLSHWFRRMCYNSPYAEHLLQMITEVAVNYPTAGFFFDCFTIAPCIGSECIREMKERGIDYTDPGELWNFAHMSQLRLQTRIAETIKNINPDLLVYFNGPGFREQENQGSYLEYECLPTGGWGYDSLPVYARYARNLGKPILNMTGRFHESWGDFGGIRTEASLEYDCINGIANCMRTTIGDHFHPRGDINYPTFDLIRNIYGRLQQLEPWIEGAKPLTDIAVIAPENAFSPGHKSCREKQLAVRGLVRALCELKYQFDVLDVTQDFSAYKLLILPDQVMLKGELATRMKKYVQTGGAVISSAWSGLDESGKNFALKAWGLDFAGDSPYDPAYMELSETGLADGFPDMPVTLYEPGTVVKVREGTQVLAEITVPYYNRKFDGEHAFLYLPPDKKSGEPALTRNGNIVHFSHPFALTYYKHAQVPMKNLLRNIIGQLLPKPIVKVKNLPSFARVTVTGQAGRRMVYLMSYVPEKRGEKVEIIEEPIELHNVKVMLRESGMKFTRAYLAPGKEPLEISEEAGYAVVTVPIIKGYSLLVFEG
ncbi:MAG: beta-galactosidase trimerization domain-containing protein [Victivallales bacterium]|nr:beta-galactosidase trimerization domain-containing protein [Victivallales bacterium]